MSKMKSKKCPECGFNLKKINVSVEGAENKIASEQCGKCGFFRYESKSSKKVIEELKEKRLALEMKQKVIKLSQGRLGLYLNKDVARCMNLKGGEEVYTSMPDKKHLIIRIGE